MAKKIIEFYGQECPYCVAIVPVVDRLEKEEDVKVERLEVWHNDKNHKKMGDLKRLYDQECEGNFVVPSFYDKESDRLICNPGSYENLKKWVIGNTNG